MNPTTDPDQIIDYLKDHKGVKINDMMEALGVERGAFLSWRRSRKPGKRKELADKLKELYSELIDEKEMGEEAPYQSKFEEKYMKLLEAENERLREENKRLYGLLEKEIKKMAGKT